MPFPSFPAASDSVPAAPSPGSGERAVAGPQGGAPSGEDAGDPSAPRYDRISVHDAGGMSVHLPIVDLGPGPPRFIVVAGIHGDEPSPLLLVDRLVVALRAFELVGGIRIVAAANP